MEKESITRLLQSTEIFNALPLAVLNELSSHATVIKVGKDETVIKKGDEGHSMFVIASGNVRIHDEAHVVATMKEGDFFGEFSLLDASPRSMSVSANSDSVLISIDRESFFSVLQRDPDLTKKIISLLTRRMRGQNSVIISQFKSREEELTRLVNERTSEVVRQKEIVEEKNKEILDSIHYAKRLQEAILPHDETVKEYFQHNFILYMPKDIVAGDFYWVCPSGNEVLIAAADCTGHGVSGALMSMLGVSLLSQIVIEKITADPSEILNSLHTAVIASLQQSSNNSNDGMDIALCSFDFKNKKLRYAGANRPLWMVRNADIEVIAPDKLPIGGLQIERNSLFTTHDINFDENTSFYLFTDGYADQFGGPSGKKLMTKKLKEVILSIQDLDMNAQKIFLKNYFDSWKDKNEQVDDVLVIGIKA